MAGKLETLACPRCQRTTQLAQTAVGTPYYLSRKYARTRRTITKATFPARLRAVRAVHAAAPLEGASLKLLIAKIFSNYAPVSSSPRAVRTSSRRCCRGIPRADRA